MKWNDVLKSKPILKKVENCPGYSESEQIIVAINNGEDYEIARLTATDLDGIYSEIWYSEMGECEIHGITHWSEFERVKIEKWVSTKERNPLESGLYKAKNPNGYEYMAIWDFDTWISHPDEGPVAQWLDEFKNKADD